MPSLFRRKLKCFYCGGQSVSAPGIAQYPSGRVRHFECPTCSAPNHLDENGEILDFVPEAPKHPAPQFARRRTSPAPSSFTASKPTPPPSPVFCRNCQNNQIIINTRIADYELPPDGHPDFDYHINVKFPEFRKALEVRYPVVCAECAPAVNDRIRTSNYKVKVASLGQMLARSGNRDVTRGGGSGGVTIKRTFERMIWLCRGYVWCYSHFVMLAWTGTGLLFPERVAGMALGVEEEAMTSWGSCVVRSLERRDVVADCYGVAARDATRFIPWSLLGFFWIYRELGLERFPEKKLVGAKEYIWLEAGVYVFRMLCWALFARGGLAFPGEVMARIHLGMFFLSIVSTLCSITCLKLEDPPSFSLREPNPIPGTPSPPSSPPREPVRPAYQALQPSPKTPLRQLGERVPPSTAASTVYSPTINRHQREISPSPETPKGARRKDPFSPDAMDWNPTEPQHALWSAPISQPSFTSFNRASPSRELQSEKSYKSPFSGKLPPAPKPPSHQLVSSLLAQKPAETPSMQPGREQFFAHRLNPQGSEFAKVSDPNYRLTSSKYPPLAPQKFFVDDEQTGLEGLFGPGLKLDDDPETPPADSQEGGWGGVAWRVALITACLGASIKLADDRVVRVTAIITASSCLFWRERGHVGVLFSVAGVLTFVLTALSALLPHDKRVKKAIPAWLTTLLVLEFWYILIKLQRRRARTFYENERKKKVAVEMEIQRAKQLKRTTKHGGFVGLGL